MVHTIIGGGVECLEFHHFHQVYGKTNYYRYNAISLRLSIRSIPPIFVPTLSRASNKNMVKRLVSCWLRKIRMQLNSTISKKHRFPIFGRYTLLDGDRLGQVPGEINIQTFTHS